MAFAVLVRSDDAIIHMLAVSLATGYSGGISGRNAGRVHIAVGQVFLTLAPTAIGLWQVEDTGYRILSGVLVLMIPGMAEISAATHRIVQIGRASCRERVCTSVSISVVAVSFNNK